MCWHSLHSPTCVQMSVSPKLPVFSEQCIMLISRQLGIGNFEPLKPYFLEVYTGAMAVLPTLPGTAVVPLPLEHAGSGAEERKPPNSPALVRLRQS